MEHATTKPPAPIAPANPDMGGMYQEARRRAEQRGWTGARARNGKAAKRPRSGPETEGSRASRSRRSVTWQCHTISKAPQPCAAGLFLWGWGLSAGPTTGGPSETASRGFAGERRSGGVSEPRRLRRGEGYGARDDEAPRTGCPRQPRHGRHVLFAELLRFYFKAIPRICGHSCF